MANAGCINAYNCDGGLIQTLGVLDSANIGVGVQFCAPDPLDDKRLDYIKYTDKCGNTCCLSGENEILIYATNGVIKNFTLTNDDTNEVVNVKRTDIFGSNRKKTVVRYKTGGYPTSITDGTLAVEELVQNQYQSSGYNVSGLTDGTTYYFSAFAVAQDDTIIVVQSSSIETSFGRKPGTNSYAYYPLTSNGNDSSGHNRNLTVGSGITFSSSNGAYLPHSAHTGMLEGFQITSSGKRTFGRRSKALGIVESDGRGIDIYFNSSYRIATLRASNSQKFAQNSSTSNVFATATETSNVRYWNVITIDNGTLKAYVDNVLKGSGSVGSSLTSTYFRRGQEYNNGANRQFYGYFKDIFIENRILSTSEMTQYREKTKSSYGK